MKTIALSMILSLAVIVCEQQTLFAPHFVSFAKAPQPTNSLVPIAGVNRSVPLAGASYNPGKGASRAIVHPQYSPSGPDRKPTVNGVSPDVAKDAFRPYLEGTPHPLPHLSSYDPAPKKDQPFDNHLGPIHDDSAFLPWHRGYFGLGGSAERIDGEARDKDHKAYWRR